jgi:hypothetical protein
MYEKSAYKLCTENQPINYAEFYSSLVVVNLNLL